MPASVKSIATIRRFRADLQEYNDSLRQTLDILSSELQRAVDYFETDRSTYWPAQVRKASDDLAAARINLERCQVTTRPGEGPSCYEEKKALQRARQRLETAQAKVKATKKWVLVVREEVDKFRSKLAQVTYLSDTEIPRAAALLERLASRLDRYSEDSTTRFPDARRAADRRSHPGDKVVGGN